MTVHVLWPTARVDIFKKQSIHWLDAAILPLDIQIYVAVNTQEEADQLEGHDVTVCGDKRKGCTWPSYCLASRLQYDPNDIIVLASDDFYVREGWDVFIREHLTGKEQALLVDDGIADYHARVVTLPILSGGCLRRLNNIIYHPIYRHLYSDNELYENLRQLKMLTDFKIKSKGMFFHEHYVNGKRDLDEVDQEINKQSHRDNVMFKTRMKLKVEERLDVSYNLLQDLSP